MKRILLILAAIPAALLVQAAPVQPEGEQIDTLRSAVVTGTRVAMERDRIPAPVSVVGRSRIETSDESALMPSLMEEVPGLFVTSRGVTGYGVSNGAAGGISLRGFSAGSGRTLILIDGHPQYMSIYGHAVADEYIADLAERVEVTRGAASVLYGSNAMGGAINIITRRPDFLGNRVNVKLMGGSYGTFRGNVTEQYSNGRFSLVANVGHDRTAGHRENSAFHSTSGMFKLSYDLSSAWRLSGDVNVVKAYSENPGSVTTPIFEGTADITRMMSWISLENHYENTDGGINFYYNAGKHLINDGYSAGGSPQAYLFHSTDYQGGVNVFQAFRPWTGGTLTGGIDVKLYGGDAYRNPVTEYYADHKKLNEEAVYLLAQQLLGPVTLEGGVRLEHHSLYGLVWVPQAGISWLAAPSTAFKFSASKGFRTPNMRELYMFPPHNEELDPEQAWSYDLTWSQHYLEGRFNTELSLFYTKGTNLIALSVLDGRRINLNTGAFANKGVEFSADFRATDQLKFNANYSYLHMDTPLVGTPVHKAYVSGTWTPGRFSANIGLMGIKDLYLSTGDNAVTSSYADLKARLSYRIADWITVFARGENLLNQSYETMLGFPEPGITVFGGVSINM
ncbi:MAG: TonB-dependent receptor [Bacteroidales bacterium]|nr:TonB-dependent receptor [Bacteroidales bacterium]